ncbi:MAG TPA: hypothetical protein PKA27_08745 [Fimbriimonadaceae bacterium]|nr:hypothetical protein [Fimbriimonadaceae bacterium]
MVNLWARMTSAAPRYDGGVPLNFSRWEAELQWILAHRQFTGVRFNIGLSDSDGIGTSTGTIDTSFVEYLLHRLASNGLKVQLDIGGEGPNPANSGWQTLNGTGGTPWDSVKRPPLGPSDAVLNRIVEIKQEVIDLAIGVYESYGLVPYDWIYIGIGNEPAIGSAGAPVSGSAFYTTFGITYSTSIGKWDKFTAGANAAKGCSFIEFLTKEVDLLDFHGLRVIAPTFASEALSVELGTDGFDQDWTTGYNWIDVVRKKTELIYAINLYYEVFDNNIGGTHAFNYVWPTCGPVRFARVALDGFDGRGYKSQDTVCVKKKLELLRAEPRIGDSRIVVTEAGVNYLILGQDAPGTSTTPTRTASYFINYKRTMEATLAYLDSLRELDQEFLHVTWYTITNATEDSDLDQRYGVFSYEMSNANSPSLQLLKTYTGAQVWARRAGLPTTSLDLTPAYTPEKGNYWHKEFLKGDDENESLPQ